VSAKASFDVLAGYFKDRAQLRRALGWSPPTMRAWEGAGPSRPRAEHVQRVGRLLAVAQAAQEWVHDDIRRVGAWLLAPNDALDGLQPATIVRTLGDEGVGRLLDGMYQIAPRTTAHAHLDLSPAQMRDALDRLGSTQLRAAPPVDVDLSDFDA
jgi:hypothetical protein